MYRFDIKEISKEDALKMIWKYHYSNTLPKINKYFVGFFLEEELVGVVLFDSTLEENVEKYFEPYTVKKVGYANDGASNLTDPKRGSRNVLESEVLENGVKMVWDEGISILENITIIGLPVLQKLRDVLEQIRDKDGGK